MIVDNRGGKSCEETFGGGVHSTGARSHLTIANSHIKGNTATNGMLYID